MKGAEEEVVHTIDRGVGAGVFNNTNHVKSSKLAGTPQRAAIHGSLQDVIQAT